MHRKLINFVGASLAIHMAALIGWSAKTPVNEVRPDSSSTYASLEIKLVDARTEPEDNITHKQEQKTIDRRKSDSLDNKSQKSASNSTQSSKPKRKPDSGLIHEASTDRKPEQHIPKLALNENDYELLIKLQTMTLGKTNKVNATFNRRRDVEKSGLQDTGRLTKHLNQVFSQYFHYPRLARRNGWQGMVKLSLRIEPNGELSHVRVLETSGFEILDQAAIESVNKISAIPGADDWLRGSHFDTVLPVRYQLIHG